MWAPSGSRAVRAGPQTVLHWFYINHPHTLRLSAANVVVNGEHYCPPDAPYDEEEKLCCRQAESAEEKEEEEKPKPHVVPSKASKGKKKPSKRAQNE